MRKFILLIFSISLTSCYTIWEAQLGWTDKDYVYHYDYFAANDQDGEEIIFFEFMHPSVETIGYLYPGEIQFSIYDFMREPLREVFRAYLSEDYATLESLESLPLSVAGYRDKPTQKQARINFSATERSGEVLLAWEVQLYDSMLEETLVNEYYWTVNRASVQQLMTNLTDEVVESNVARGDQMYDDKNNHLLYLGENGNVPVLATTRMRPLVMDEQNETVTKNEEPATDTDRSIPERAFIELEDSGVLQRFYNRTGRRPTIVVAELIAENGTTQAATFTRQFESQIIDSGLGRVVAADTERDVIRTERMDQQTQASSESVKRLGEERGADFVSLIHRTVFSETQSQIDIELINIETAEKLWVGQYQQTGSFVTVSRQDVSTGNDSPAVESQPAPSRSTGLWRVSEEYDSLKNETVFTFSLNPIRGHEDFGINLYYKKNSNPVLSSVEVWITTTSPTVFGPYGVAYRFENGDPVSEFWDREYRRSLGAYAILAPRPERFVEGLIENSFLVFRVETDDDGERFTSPIRTREATFDTTGFKNAIETNGVTVDEILAAANPLEF